MRMLQQACDPTRVAVDLLPPRQLTADVVAHVTQTRPALALSRRRRAGGCAPSAVSLQAAARPLSQPPPRGGVLGGARAGGRDGGAPAGGWPRPRRDHGADHPRPRHAGVPAGRLPGRLGPPGGWATRQSRGRTSCTSRRKEVNKGRQSHAPGPTVTHHTGSENQPWSVTSPPRRDVLWGNFDVPWHERGSWRRDVTPPYETASLVVAPWQATGVFCAAEVPARAWGQRRRGRV